VKRVATLLFLVFSIRGEVEKHPEVNWSEVIRRAVKNELAERAKRQFRGHNLKNQ
jgi:metal-responsive CopG/Arc/MetJ family transcriptional regulator